MAMASAVGIMLQSLVLQTQHTQTVIFGPAFLIRFVPTFIGAKQHLLLKP